MNLVSLSDRCKEIILGSLLGDGSLKIHKPYKNARFSFRHSISQKEYFLWKAKELKEISSEKYFWEQGKDGKDGWGGMKLRYQSRAIESLSELYRLTHKKGKLQIRRKWLNMLSPLSLTIWWLDDGSLVSNSRKGVFCTDGFPREEVLLLKRYLKTVWKIEAVMGKVKSRSQREHYRLWIRSTETLKKFLRMILPHIPVESMLPKVIILYKDSQLQQRWISEICHLSNISRNIVEKYAREKKMKWRMFRE